LFASSRNNLARKRIVDLISCRLASFISVSTYAVAAEQRLPSQNAAST
jgi:hypothetical protein